MAFFCIYSGHVACRFYFSLYIYIVFYYTLIFLFPVKLENNRHNRHKVN